jgi:hypothetical protein
VRLRLSLIPLVCSAFLLAPSGAPGYPWPLKPFHAQHPIRGGFGDPRTVFAESLFGNGIEGTGAFQFHNGIDIVAADGTAVYPVESGTVHMIDASALSVTSADGRTFQYFHVVPTVTNGQHVKALRTVLGHVLHGEGHVHLSEIRGFRIWNPLAKGGIAPYRDDTDPTVRTIYIRRWGTLQPLDPKAVCGKVSIVADAFDTQSPRAPGAFAGFPIAPALLRWSVVRAGTTRSLEAATGAIDFRTTLPPRSDFWKIYARGTYQNSPRFGRRQYSMAGLYLYQLTRQGLDTEGLANGTYRVTVRASDVEGNSTTYARDFTVANDLSTLTGCPEPAPKPRPIPTQPPLSPVPAAREPHRP